MIPKIIHYCWFGGDPLPESAHKCIESWKKYCPDYDIRKWDDNNYNVRKIPYIAEAYDAKKYAFVSDYARFDILYEYGGIYLDVDVEVIRPIDGVIDDTGFMGMEITGDNLGIGIASGLGVGCIPGLEIVKEILGSYAGERFIRGGKMNLKTVVTRVTDILTEKGFDTENVGIQKIAGLTIYPPEYFAPKNAVTGITKITRNTYSIHHYDASWVPVEDVRIDRIRRKIYSVFGDNAFAGFVIFCAFNFRPTAVVFHFFVRFFIEIGPIGTLRYYKKRIFGGRE